MANLNILGMIGAVAIVGVVAAGVEAANRSKGKSYKQCHSDARSLGWNANDEADRWGYDEYMAKCQYGPRADEQTAREYEHYKATRGKPQPVQAVRQERPRQAPRKVVQNDFERWQMGPAQAQYRQYGVSLFEACTVVKNAHRDTDPARFIWECMSGRRATR